MAVEETPSITNNKKHFPATKNKKKKERIVCILGRIKNTVTETILSNNELQSFEYKEPKPILWLDFQREESKEEAQRK